MPAFPFSPMRSGQRQLVEDIQGVLAQGGVLLCAAPTGIGKTAAALWPALECAMRESRQVFFVTAKTSQQELALETLERMLDPHESPGAVQIATRERFCPRDGRSCGERLCRFRRATQREACDALAPRLGTAAARAEHVRDLALGAGLCPFEVSLRLAERAHAIVGDFNYVFDPRSYLRRFFDRDHSQQLLIVDEAHNLPDRVATFDSPVLDRARLRALAARCRQLALEPFGAAALLFETLEQRAAALLEELTRDRAAGPPFVARLRPALFADLSERLQALDEAYAELVKDHGGAPSLLAPPRAAGELASPRDPMSSTLHSIAELARVSGEPAERFAGIYEPDRIQALCLEPGERIRDRIHGFHATVCMSATLTPFAFHQRRLGLEGPHVLTVALPSPFPREHRCLVVVPDIDTRWVGRERDADRVASRIAQCVRLRPGNYLAFFPSYAYRDRVVACWSARERRELGVLLQLPGLPAEALVARLRQNRRETRLLCGVQGGVLAEGVDYPGELAIGVFIVGPALPSVAPEREVLRAHYDGALGDPEAMDPDEAPPAGAGFELAYVHPAIQRVVQAAGRVIRTPSDRAFIVLLGRRFAEPLYRDKLPQDWREDWIETTDPAPVLRRFWKGFWESGGEADVQADEEADGKAHAKAGGEPHTPPPFTAPQPGRTPGAQRARSSHES